MALSSCMKDDEFWASHAPPPQLPGEGVFIINEGNFQYENASLSYYNIEDKELYNDIFFNTNGVPLGDIAYSMTIRDSLGYIVINNSGKINVININTFRLTGKITGLVSPRHIHFINDSKAYVTDLYARTVSIVDPRTLQVTGHIDVSNAQQQFNQHPTEQMVAYGKYVFTNCWSFDNTILVLDTESDRVVDSIEVLIQPVAMALDRLDKLWVLTDGGFEGSPYGYQAPGLLRIDAAAREIEWTYRFTLGDRPTELTMNGTRDTLYFINRHVWRFAIETDDIPALFIESPYPSGSFGGYYGLGIDPVTSEVYVADAIDQVQRGVVYRYSPGGHPIDTLKTGIAPAAFCFKP